MTLSHPSRHLGRGLITSNDSVSTVMAKSSVIRHGLERLRFREEMLLAQRGGADGCSLGCWPRAPRAEQPRATAQVCGTARNREPAACPTLHSLRNLGP